MSGVLDRVTKGVRALRWFITSLMGDRAYEVYVAHLEIEHPGQPPMTERAYWVKRSRDQDENAGARCC
jgi:uncharacterized short protein YbdD (DUF466 family)